MEQIYEFGGNHWQVFALLGLNITLLAGIHGWAALVGVTQVGPMDATRLINQEDAVIIDIRGKSEYSAGHILNALSIPMEDLAKRIEEIKKHQGKPVVISCQTGARTAKAAALLKKAGIEKLFKLRGGVMAWQGADLPLTKAKAKA